MIFFNIFSALAAARGREALASGRLCSHAYAATRCPVLTHAVCSYARSGTNVGHGATRRGVQAACTGGAQGLGGRCEAGRRSALAPQTPAQETAISVQFVPGMRVAL
eukprot:2945042-Rhodomonas_salina.1